ncbi:MAG: DUF72 domain-containing protein [Thermoplasmata archaeon]
MIRIGTCGWSYKDWIGTFYPESMRDRRGGWLEYYGKFFPTVEIDSTYYAVPGERTIQAWIAKGKRMQDFDFSLKMHKDITHMRILRNGERAATAAKEFETTVVRPLAENSLLASVLIQLSPRFKVEEGGGSLDRLKAVLETLDTDKHDYVVEFRHKSWLDDSGYDYLPSVRELLSQRNVAVCSLDSPYFPKTETSTADHAYVRFHGRNYDIWWKGEEQIKDHRINRYDYLYKDEELDMWIPTIREFDSRAEKTRIYFNNHGKAKAARNALQLMDRLDIPHRKKEIRIKEQFTLESFS